MPLPRFRTTASGVYYIEDFEGLKCFPVDQVNKPTPNTTHAIENNGSADALSFPVYQGSKCARFRLLKTEPLFQGTTYRTEVTTVKAEDDARVTTEGWYSFKFLLPTDGGGADARKSSINQWFEDGGNELTLRTKNGTCFLELENGGKVYTWDVFSTAKNVADGSVENITGFVPHELDRWNQLVFHINHKLDASGFIEVYKNGIKLHRYDGPTIHEKVPKWKIGLYSSQSKSTLPYKIIFFDDIRVGNNTATLGDMVGGTGGGIVPPLPPVTDELNVFVDNDQVLDLPINSTTFVTRISGMKAGMHTVSVSAIGPDGASSDDEIKIDVRPEEVIPPEPPDTGAAIQEFILVDAGTEKDIVTLAEGGKYKTEGRKLNVRVTVNSEVGKVEFVCTGPSPKTSTDKGAPFSLHGDNGQGNYYYGNWGPPGAGAYKIVANPLTASGAALTSKTINFTFE